MIIDNHIHLGRLKNSKNEMPLIAENLIREMDKEGIDKAVALPNVSPETSFSPPLPRKFSKKLKSIPIDSYLFVIWILGQAAVN